eukprot:tig00000147_g9491.t1
MDATAQPVSPMQLVQALGTLLALGFALAYAMSLRGPRTLSSGARASTYEDALAVLRAEAKPACPWAKLFKPLQLSPPTEGDLEALRAASKRAFLPARVQLLLPEAWRSVEALLQQLEVIADSNLDVDLVQILHLYSAELAWRTLFGSAHDFLARADDKLAQSYLAAVEDFEERAAGRGGGGPRLPSARRAEEARARVVRAWVESAVRLRKEHLRYAQEQPDTASPPSPGGRPFGRRCLLDDLLLEGHWEGVSEADAVRTVARAATYIFFTVERKLTASLAWLLFHVGSDPKVSAAVGAEAYEFSERFAFDFSAIKAEQLLDEAALPLLTESISESLRVQPPLRAVHRVLAAPLELAGRGLPAGSRAAADLPAAMRDFRGRAAAGEALDPPRAPRPLPRPAPFPSHAPAPRSLAVRRGARGLPRRGLRPRPPRPHLRRRLLRLRRHGAPWRGAAAGPAGPFNVPRGARLKAVRRFHDRAAPPAPAPAPAPVPVPAPRRRR